MGKYFVRNAPLTGLEQEMMLPPDFVPRGSGSAILCGDSPHGAGVACHPDHRRQSRRTLVCLHITEHLQTGVTTMAALIFAAAAEQYAVLPDLTPAHNIEELQERLEARPASESDLQELLAKAVRAVRIGGQDYIELELTNGQIIGKESIQ